MTSSPLAGKFPTCQNPRLVIAMPAGQPLFFSCDWGTSSFRLRLAQEEEGRVLAGFKSSRGAKTITGELRDPSSPSLRAKAYHDYLAEQVNALLEQSDSISSNTPIIVSGMASSSVGWMELPYADVPFPVDGSGATVRELRLGTATALPATVLLVSGVSTSRDMMRGEETELIGLLSQPSLAPLATACRVVLPGTHSKHIIVRDGRMVDFATYMSGEMFDVLCRHSILRFTTERDDGERTDTEAFREGVRACRENGLAQSLFQARTRAVLQGESPSSNTDFLNGLLIGSEMIDLTRASGRIPVLVAAPKRMTDLYAMAADELKTSNRISCVHEPEWDRAVVLGQRRILQHWRKRRHA